MGHFAVARFIGVAVEEFGFGLPPRMWGKKIRNTIYSLNWLPIGGFVKLAGEDEESKIRVYPEKCEAFILGEEQEGAGSDFDCRGGNEFYRCRGYYHVFAHAGRHGAVGQSACGKSGSGGPAEKAGIKIGDRIISIVSPLSKLPRELRLPKELIEETKLHQGEQVQLTLVRDGKELTVLLVPEKNIPRVKDLWGWRFLIWNLTCIR